MQCVAIIALVLLFTMALLYLLFSGYHDHCEALVASASAMLLQGEQPLYHAMDAAARYSVSYGPMLYLLVALPAVVLGASIPSSKIAGLLACALAVWVLFKTICRHCEPPMARLLTGLFALVLLLFENYGYWNRPDPFLLLCVALGLAATTQLSLRRAAIVIGALSAVSTNLKIHGAVYMLPAISILLMRHPRQANLILASTVAITLFAAPFLLPQISMADYLRSLNVAAGHGLSMSKLFSSIAYLSVMLTPLIGLILMAPAKAQTPNQWLPVGALLAAVLVVTLFAAKRGAGPHHYLPLLPSMIYLCSLQLKGQGKSDLLARIREQQSAFAGLLLLALSCVVLSAMALYSQATMMTELASHRTYSEASRELDQILGRYAHASIQMGYSDQANYRFTNLRPSLVARGHPYRLDAVALMDYDAAGVVMPAATLAALEACETELWILPVYGAPFSMINYYATRRNIFGAQFGRIFSRNYQLVDAGKYYAVWACRTGPG